jgi:SAM-dependent methyltransferase
MAVAAISVSITEEPGPFADEAGVIVCAGPMPAHLRRSAAGASLASLLLATAAAAQPQRQPRTLEECQAAYPASWGQAGKDVVWVPTSDAVVRAMLSMTQVTPQDRVLDLGAGDGKIPIFAAKAFGARAVGIEYEPGLAKLATCLVRVAGLADKVRIIEGDIFKVDFGDATVVTMYLLQPLNLCVRHRLLAMAPGTRVASHHYDMGEWTPDQSARVEERAVHSWVVPARVGGVWEFKDSGGTPFTVSLRQTFGTVAGEVTRGGPHEALANATLRGVELRFTFGAGAEAVKFAGTVKGGEITGVLSSGKTARTAVGRLRGALQPAPWADMPSECRHYYGG